MEHALAQLGRARPGVGAPDVGVSLLRRGELGAALRAVRRHDELALVPGAGVDHRTENLRNDLSRFANDDRVPDQHTLALDLRGVVQGGQGDGRARDEDGLHERERGDAAGSSDVDPDVEQRGGGLLRRVLERDGPARRTGGVAQPSVQRHPVDLDHQAVDLVLDVVPMRAPVLHALDHLVRTVRDDRVRRHGQPPGRQRVVRRGLGLRLEPLQPAEAVADHAEATPSGDRGVLLPQRPGRGIARIGERRLALLDQRGVQRLEVAEPEEHLTAHLQQCRDGEFRGAGEGLGNIVDGTGIEGDVLPRPAVPPRGRALENTVAVHQVQGDPVDLHLAQVGQVGPRFGLDPADPRPQLVDVEHVVQRQHSFEVVDGREVRLESAAHQLRG